MIVKVTALPPDLGTYPQESQAAFRTALGREFVVAGRDEHGHLELVLGPEMDALLGGFQNTIWIESEFVEVIGS